MTSPTAKAYGEPPSLSGYEAYADGCRLRWTTHICHPTTSPSFFGISELLREHRQYLNVDACYTIMHV